jgi:hypothetical protein
MNTPVQEFPFVPATKREAIYEADRRSERFAKATGLQASVQLYEAELAKFGIIRAANGNLVEVGLPLSLGILNRLAAANIEAEWNSRWAGFYPDEADNVLKVA